MRQRKRADWPVCVYQYWVRLEAQTWEELPEGARQDVEAQRALWNQLVAAFERRLAEYRAIVSQLPQLAALREKAEGLRQQVQQAAAALRSARQQLRRQAHPDLAPFEEAKRQAQQALREARTALQTAQRSAAETVRPALRHLQASFLAEAKRLTASSPAAWASRQFIHTQFLAAVGRFFNKQGRPPKPKLGVPRVVHFHHRFTEGGLPVERVFGGSQRLRLTPVPPEAFRPSLPQRQRKRLARTAGTFQVGEAALAFHTILHRPLPAGAYLKAATLIGRQVGRGGYHRHHGGGHPVPAQWTWSLHLTLEIPPHPPPARQDKRPVAALGLSPRLVGEGQLRIGVLLDSTGREEALFLPEAILRFWQYRRALQSQADRLLAETKARLRNTPCPEPLPLAAQQLFRHLGTVRDPGLRHLLRLLEEAGAAGAALEILRRWADRATRLLREARGLERRYLGHRNWFYHNTALQLCRGYQKLVVETCDMRAPGALQREENNPLLQEAATYRQLVAPSRFVTILRQAAAKTDTELTESHPASAASPCPVCGAQAVKDVTAVFSRVNRLMTISPNVYRLYELFTCSHSLENRCRGVFLECPNGHQWDQDRQRARNLLLRAVA